MKRWESAVGTARDTSPSPAEMGRVTQCVTMEQSHHVFQKPPHLNNISAVHVKSKPLFLEFLIILSKMEKSFCWKSARGFHD